MHPLATQQYRMIHDIYVLMDDGDRRVLRPFNLSTSQYALLQLLDGEAGWRLTDLSERLLLDKSTVTRLIDRLEQAELVRRIADPSDRRVQRVLLTVAGQRQRDAAREAHERSLERRLSVLEPEEQRHLSTLLAKLCRGLAAELNQPEELQGGPAHA
ncbi:MAG: MarR family transcriptional regulator [Chloroflexi bacterium OHK40]